MFRYLVVVVSFLIFVEIGGNKCKYNNTSTWHTSQLVLRKLYNLQKEHFNVINDYLDEETKRVEKLKK